MKTINIYFSYKESALDLQERTGAIVAQLPKRNGSFKFVVTFSK